MRIQPCTEDLIGLTHMWKGARFEDGRPRVSDDVLAELRRATTEHIWSVLWSHGYERQFEGNWRETHPDTILVGRAVTAQFVPHRPDFDEVVLRMAAADGQTTTSDRQNWLVVEALTENDVMVVDLYGKIYQGTLIGDNLGTAVASRTGAGAVIHGGIRDLQGIRELANVNIFHRGVDPTPIKNVTLAGMNIPVRIGGATVLPGDVVLGTPTGVLFVPPHLAEIAAAESADKRRRDAFGKQRLGEGRYNSAQIDVPRWAPSIEADYQAWSAEGAEAAVGL